MVHLDVQHRSVHHVEEFFLAEKKRHFLYQKVILSAHPSGGDCIVLFKHGLWNQHQHELGVVDDEEAYLRTDGLTVHRVELTEQKITEINKRPARISIRWFQQYICDLCQDFPNL